MAQTVKCLVYHVEDPGSIPGSGRYPGEGTGNPFQYSCLENPMDRGAWQATVHRVAKSQTLSDLSKQRKINLYFKYYLQFNYVELGGKAKNINNQNGILFCSILLQEEHKLNQADIRIMLRKEHIREVMSYSVFLLSSVSKGLYNDKYCTKGIENPKVPFK